MASFKRKYAAYYRRKGTRRWTRLHPSISASKDSIVRTYQAILLYSPFDNREYSIRPVSRKKTR